MKAEVIDIDGQKAKGIKFYQPGTVNSFSTICNWVFRDKV